MKANSVAYIINPPPEYFNWLSPLPDKVSIKNKLSHQLDFIHLFVSDQKSFQVGFDKAKACLSPQGMLWVSWPKKSSKMAADLDENIIREYGLKQGLVDVKVCAVSDIWSGLKFVYRLKDR